MRKAKKNEQVTEYTYNFITIDYQTVYSLFETLQYHIKTIFTCADPIKIILVLNFFKFIHLFF
jgi:hypothetical protein